MNDKKTCLICKIAHSEYICPEHATPAAWRAWKAAHSHAARRSVLQAFPTVRRLLLPILRKAMRDYRDASAAYYRAIKLERRLLRKGLDGDTAGVGDLRRRCLELTRAHQRGEAWMFMACMEARAEAIRGLPIPANDP